MLWSKHTLLNCTVPAVAAFTGEWSGSQFAQSGQKAVHASFQSLALMVMTLHIKRTAAESLERRKGLAESSASCCQPAGSSKQAKISFEGAQAARLQSILLEDMDEAQAQLGETQLSSSARQSSRQTVVYCAAHKPV